MRGFHSVDVEVKRSHSDRVAWIWLRKAATAESVTQSHCSVRMCLVIDHADSNFSPQLRLLLLDRSDTLTVPELERNAKTKNPVPLERKYVKIPAPCFHEKSEKVCFCCISALYHD